MDTFRDLFRGNLNDSIDISRFLEPYKKLAKNNKCLFLFCHHIGKGKENNTAPSKNDVLGSSGIESACRTVLMLKKRPDGKRILTVVKGNKIPDEYKNKGMILNFDIESGFNPTGETINFFDENNVVRNESEAQVDLVEEIVTRYPRLKSYRKVADELRTIGHTIDKNGVGKIWNESRPSVRPKH